MHRLLVITLLVVGSSAVALATGVPEVDPSSGANALALIAAGLMILRSRRKA